MSLKGNIEVSKRKFCLFETIDMLHRRSRLYKDSSKMTQQERFLLMRYDLKLLENVERMVEHIGKVYDFFLSAEPLEEWWWHLDKVASGELEVEIGLRQKDKVL
ncbi:hypothetical protein [Neobacillus sp. 114]|uniref:hypothetical protein n=1 Tax=Neobacillus sp. 114 TaxID=3048535 RepID=UPI0024C2898B|nr:hypothetical protein [Neobacillus sp. 114]